MNKKKGQVAIEYIILIGLVIGVILPIFYYSMTTINRNVQMNKATAAVKAIIETADTLYALGHGSRETITVEFPGGIQSITIQGKEVDMKIIILGEEADIFAISKADLNGSLNPQKGSWHILLENDNNEIQISNKY